MLISLKKKKKKKKKKTKKKKKKKKAQQNIRSHPPTWILPEITAIVAGIAPLFFTIFSTSLATLCRKKIQR